MASTVVSRWRGKLQSRLWLLKAARKRHEAHPTKASRALVERRKSQVSFARRVIDRHVLRRATTISTAGLNLIAGFEGCILHPYQDSVGVWTIGFGHTEGVGPRSPSLPSRTAALELLRRDVNRKYGAAVAALHLPLKQHRFDALTSLAYNLGPGILAPSTTIGAALRRHDWKAAADAFLLYDHAGGQRLPGLTRRRMAERRLFLDA